MRTTTHPKSIQPSPARAILYELSSKRDSPANSGEAGVPNTPIHREPGLWLFMTNETSDGLDIGRLGSVPHGDSLMCLGRSQVIEGAPDIGPINGLPIGVSQAQEPGYFAPYQHFIDAPFKGNVTAPGFPGFSPADASALLRAGLPKNVKSTTILHVDSTVDHAGIHNIPFIVRQADAVSMNATFWIMELDETDENGEPKLVLQYAQSILLDFFGRKDGNPGRVQWPHVSINTMERASAPKPSPVQMESLS